MKTPPMTPNEFREHVMELSRKEFHAAADDANVKACLDAGDPYAETWKEAAILNHSLETLDVPAPRTNIAASVMASIANERTTSEDKTSKDSFGTRVVEIVRWQFQIPAWGVAALVLLLIGSISMNLLNGKVSNNTIQPQNIIANNPTNTPINNSPVSVDQPQIIVLPQIDQTPNSFVPVSSTRGLPLSANPSPSLVIIMGATPSSWLTENYEYQPLSNVSLKENEI